MVKLNAPAPGFKLEAYHNDKFISVNSDSFKGKWAVIMFYPADFTFVCPTELGEMADYYEEFQKINVEVYSCSSDTKFCHKAWHDASETIKKIKFPMLADPTGNFCREFGVMDETEGVAFRGTYIINPDGNVVAYEMSIDGIGRSAAELLRKVQAAQFSHEHGEVCPASWKPGAKTFKPGVDLVGKI